VRKREEGGGRERSFVCLERETLEAFLTFLFDHRKKGETLSVSPEEAEGGARGIVSPCHRASEEKGGTSLCW